MRVDGHRPDELARAARGSRSRAVRFDALERRPAEVLRRLVGLERHAVDLLDLVLAHVADPQLAERRGRTRSARGCAGRRATTCQRGVAPRVDVGGEELAEPRVEVLRVAVRVERAAAVAQAEIQPAVGAEGELAAVVVLLGLVDEQELAARAGSRRSPRSEYSSTRVSPRRSE